MQVQTFQYLPGDLQFVLFNYILLFKKWFLVCRLGKIQLVCLMWQFQGTNIRSTCNVLSYSDTWLKVSCRDMLAAPVVTAEDVESSPSPFCLSFSVSHPSPPEAFRNHLLLLISSILSWRSPWTTMGLSPLVPFSMQTSPHFFLKKLFCFFFFWLLWQRLLWPNSFVWHSSSSVFPWVGLPF